MEQDGLGEIGANVPGKGEKLEAEIERIGKDMQPENVIAHEVNVDLKINDEFDLKSNLENLTLEKLASSTTEGPPKVVEQDEQDQEDHDEPVNEQPTNEQSEMKIMKINDEFDLKKNLEIPTTVEPVVVTEEPRIEHNESEKTEGDTAQSQPTLSEVTDENIPKANFEVMDMGKLPVLTTTESSLVDAYESATDNKGEAELDGTEHSTSLLKPSEKLDLSIPTTTENPTTAVPESISQPDTDDFDVKESEDRESFRHPNEKMFGKFSEKLRNRILKDPRAKNRIKSPQEPEIYFKAASVPDDSDSDSDSETTYSNVPRNKQLKHRTDEKSEGYIPGVSDSILVTPEPTKPEENEERSKETIRNRIEIEANDEERSKDTIRHRIEVVEVKDEDDEWISWDLVHMLLLLSPYDDDEITWWTIVIEAVKCSLRNCPTKNSHFHHRSVDLPRITRHRRQDSEFDPEAAPISTTPKPCMCKDLEGYFERMYESRKSNSTSS